MHQDIGIGFAAANGEVPGAGADSVPVRRPGYRVNPEGYAARVLPRGFGGEARVRRRVPDGSASRQDCIQMM